MSVPRHADRRDPFAPAIAPALARAPRRGAKLVLAGALAGALAFAFGAGTPTLAAAQEPPPGDVPTITVFVQPSLAAVARLALAGALRGDLGAPVVVSDEPTLAADLAVSWKGLAGAPAGGRKRGRAAYVPVAHFACPVGSVPLARLRAAFSGRSTSWASFGGPRRKVVPVMVAPGGAPDPFALAALRLPRVRKVRLVRTAAQALALAASRPGVIALVPLTDVNVRVRPLAVSGSQGLANGGAAPYPLATQVTVERTHEPTPADTSTPEPTTTPAPTSTLEPTSTTTTPTVDPTSTAPTPGATSTAAARRQRAVATLYKRLVATLVRPAPAKPITIVAVGDVMLSRNVLRAMYSADDWRLPFRRTRSILAVGDVTFGNLESPFSDRGGPVLSGMSFKAEPGSISGLVSSGFDVVSLANNHFGNQGRYGMNYTFRHLRAAGIEYCGAGTGWREAHTAAVVERKGVKVAFLSYNEIWPYEYTARSGSAGLAWMQSPSQIRADIRAARARADLVIVSYHWGIEYTPHPNGRQRAYGRLAVDAGADAVISQHPHVVQAVEWRKGHLIAYSLGNFVFDQMWSQETREGLIAHVYAQDGRIAGVTLTPTVIEDYSTPRLAGRGEARRILSRVWTASGVKRW